MPKFRNYQTNFSGGLLSEGMLGRVDLSQYENGCKQLENWWPKVTGGMRRRPGSLYLNTLADAVRIESFIFSETQTYVVAFTPPDNVTVWNPDTGALVADLTTGFSLTEPIINEMSVTQAGDVMFLAHGDWIMQKLVREGSATFQFYNFEWEGTGPDQEYPKKMPFVKFASGGSEIHVSNYRVGHTATVTCSEEVFTDRHLGRAIRYRGKQLVVSYVPPNTEANPDRQPSDWCSAVIKEELDQGAILGFNSSVDDPKDFNVDEIIVGRDSGTKAQVISTDTSSIVVAMISGKFAPLTTEEVEGLESGNICKITSNVDTNPPDSADWDEEAFSDEHGWPTVIEFHSQRLWLGGSSSLPAHIFGSRVAAFFDFDVGDALPADSIQVAIAGKQINLVTDIVSGRHLQVFTDKGEFYAPQSEDRPLTPELFDLKPQTRYGSRRTIEPKVFDESTIFVQAQGSAIREFIWQDNQKGYSSDAISLIAEEFLNDVQEVEVLYGGYDRPESIVFFVNGDGTITWYHSARAESIRTWGIWTTDGLYRSLAVVQDKLFVLVDRNGSTYLERFELDVTLDCASQLTGSEQTSWTIPDNRFDGVTVGVTTGVVAHDPDFYMGEYVVAGDQLDAAPIKRDNVTIGLGYEQIGEPMPIEVKDQQGVSTGLPKRIVSADIYIASTMAVQLQGNTVLTYLGQNDLTAKPEPITGVRKFYLLGYSDRPTVVFRNKVPLPCEVLSLGTEVEY